MCGGVAVVCVVVVCVAVVCVAVFLRFTLQLWWIVAVVCDGSVWWYCVWQ